MHLLNGVRYYLADYLEYDLFVFPSSLILPLILAFRNLNLNLGIIYQHLNKITSPLLIWGG
ncbi:MAG TPA: hypothetical protein DCL08_00535 [Anaerolineaceae bacterium]|nr:hypothetical protein [Anaerolineaceae bacterium]